MKKAIVQLLEDPYRMSLQVHDNGSITDGLQHHVVVVQIEQQKDHVRFLLENRHHTEQKWCSISQEEWQRLHQSPDWQHVSWFPFVAYERITSRGKATLTHRDDPVKRKRHDLISSEFWQARLYLPEGIITTFTEFSCLEGQDEAFCKASGWTVFVEQGKYQPAYTISVHEEESSQYFHVAKGCATDQSSWRECSASEIACIMAQYEKMNGHSTILVGDLQSLKALLPDTKVAEAHSPTGLPVH